MITFDQVVFVELQRLENCDDAVEYWKRFKVYKEDREEHGDKLCFKRKRIYAKGVNYREFLDCFAGLTYEECRRLTYVISFEGAVGCKLKTEIYGSLIHEHGKMRHQSIFLLLLMLYGATVQFDL